LALFFFNLKANNLFCWPTAWTFQCDSLLCFFLDFSWFFSSSLYRLSCFIHCGFMLMDNSFMFTSNRQKSLPPSQQIQKYNNRNFLDSNTIGIGRAWYFVGLPIWSSVGSFQLNSTLLPTSFALTQPKWPKYPCVS